MSNKHESSGHSLERQEENKGSSDNRDLSSIRLEFYEHIKKINIDDVKRIIN